MGINCILSGQIVDQSQTKVAGYVEEQIATAGQTQFIIGLETFDNTTDELWVYSGITTLSPVSDYTVAGRIITLKEGVPEGRSITIRVLQNVLTDGTQLVSGALIVDGTITDSKLQTNYLNLINEIDNKVNNINPQDDRILSTIDGEFVINGNGYLKDNTNFNRLEFDSNKTNNSFGSFKVPVNSGYSAYSDLIPIDNTKDYLFSMDAITQNAQATLFGRIEYLDANGNSLGDSGYVAAQANIPPSDSWQTYSATITASNRPSATTQIKIHWLFNHLAVDDYIWITNVKFKAIKNMVTADIPLHLSVNENGGLTITY